MSVFDAVGLVLPGLERRGGFVRKQLGRSDRPSCQGLGQLMVDEVVRESGGGGFLSCTAEVEPREVGPVDGGEAHRAGLAAGVEVAAGEMKVAQLPAGVANGHDFGMSRRIVRRSDAVAAAPDDVAPLNDYRSKRAALPCRDAVDRQPNGLSHERGLSG